MYRADDGSLVRQSKLGGTFVALQLGGETAFRGGYYGLEELDLISGRVTDHKGESFPPVLTVDGRCALFRHNNVRPGQEFLGVRDTKTGKIVAEHEIGGLISRIRAARDGGAYFTVDLGNAGYRYDPTEHTVKQLWRLRDQIWEAGDFDPEQGLGVSIDSNYTSRVFRLDTGKTVLTIQPVLGWWEETSWRSGLLLFGVLAVVLGVAVRQLFRTRRPAVP